MARILVMEHETDIRHLLRAVLEDEGHSVVEAHKSYEGIESFQDAPGEVVTSDIMYLVAF